MSGQEAAEAAPGTTPAPAPAQPSPRAEAPQPHTGGYQRLAHGAVRHSIASLNRRITRRFPERSLGRVCRELLDVVDDIGGEHVVVTRRVRAVRMLCRLGVALVVLVLGAAVSLAAIDVVSRPGEVHPADWIPLIESLVNDLVFGSIAIFFLRAVPTRMQRARVLRVLHRLRSLAHVIDMHQLTKVPDRLRRGASGGRDFDMTREQLTIYLEYSSEMLSLVGKTAALFADDTTDTEVLEAVSGIESLTSDMARKVWQKIAIVQQQSI